MTLEEYAKERGLPSISVEMLIDSHRRLLEELQDGQRKEWREAMEEARNRAYRETLDSRYVLIDDLRKMNLKQLCDLLGFGESE